MSEKKKKDGRTGTPDSPMYDLIFLIVRLWLGGRQKIEVDDERLKQAQAPYIMLVNHGSFYDFYYVSKLAHPKRPSYLVNEYYCTRPILKHMAKGGGILSKKLFTRDMNTAVGLLRTVRRGYPVVIFPEGRLSPDGRSNPIVEKGGALYKKLNVDLVLTRIEGAYFAAPKWRKKSYHSRVRIRVERVISREELKKMSAAELDGTIDDFIRFDASEAPIDRYPQKDKALGLDTLLYRCADCGALYRTEGVRNELICHACGSRHELDESYRFIGKPGTIAEYYDAIKAMERRELDNFRLDCAVKTKLFGANGGPVRWEEGECMLTPDAFAYRSPSLSFEIPMDRLPALAFSCGEEFELYHADELFYFYPKEQPKQVARWALLVDLLHEEKNASPDPKGEKTDA